MVEEARLISDRLGANTYIKIPATFEGVKAMKLLHDEGHLVTATAVTSLMQGLLSMYAGADYVAIYYAKMVESGVDSAFVTENLNHRFKEDSSKTKMLGASFKTAQDVANCYALGAECCTIPYDLFKNCLGCPISVPSIEAFSSNWKKVFEKPYTELIMES